MWNIYDFSSKKEFESKFGFVHNVLKYKIIVPLVDFLAAFVEKRVDVTMTYSKHTKIYFVMQKALETTKKKWTTEWACETYNTTPKKIHKHLQKQYRIIDNFKKLLFVVCKYDTAYDAFIKIFSFEFVKEMQLKYNGDKYQPLYCSKKVNDISYLLINDGYATLNGKRYKVVLEEDKNGNDETKENK